MNKARLLTRGDDFGSFRTANLAIRDCVDRGILKNVSIMVITPYWEEAVEMFKDRDNVCLGVHLAINAEWDNIRWHPVLPAGEVSSLLAEDGAFRQQIQDQSEADLDEIMAECKAQVDLARKRGLNIEYIDEHCVFGWFRNGELKARLAEFAAEAGLVYGNGFTFERLQKIQEGNISSCIKALETMERGKTYLQVGHPCYPFDEIADVVHSGLEPGDVSGQRDFQRLMFMNPEIAAYCKNNNIELIKYSDLK